MAEDVSSDEEINIQFGGLKSAKLMHKISKSKVELVKMLDLQMKNDDDTTKINDQLDIPKDYIKIDMGIAVHEICTSDE